MERLNFGDLLNLVVAKHLRDTTERISAGRWTGDNNRFRNQPKSPKALPAQLGPASDSGSEVIT
jgi:hypothetical protein